MSARLQLVHSASAESRWHPATVEALAHCDPAKVQHPRMALLLAPPEVLQAAQDLLARVAGMNHDRAWEALGIALCLVSNRLDESPGPTAATEPEAR
jgi:hypothetical protein